MPRRWHQVGGSISAGDGGKQARSPGRARRKPLKPLRGECRVEPGVTVVTMLVCFFILHARLRAHCAPGIPCALIFSGRKIHASLGRFARRECGGGSLTRHVIPGRAPARTRNLEIPRCAIAHLRSGPSDHPGMTTKGRRCAGPWIASLALAMTSRLFIPPPFVGRVAGRRPVGWGLSERAHPSSPPPRPPLRAGRPSPLKREG